MANFRALQSFIERENVFAELFGNEILPGDVRQLTEEQATNLFHNLDNAMSPENLHCDGECSAAQVRRQANLFVGAVNDLKTLGFDKPTNVGCI